MFSHVLVGSNDIDASRRFYDALFCVLGVGPGKIDANGRILYFGEAGIFAVTRPIDGRPARGAERSELLHQQLRPIDDHGHRRIALGDRTVHQEALAVSRQVKGSRFLDLE